LDTTGAPAVITAAIRGPRLTGSCGLVGSGASEVRLDPGALLGKTVMGIFEGNAVPQQFIPQLIELWQAGRFPFDRLIETFPCRRSTKPSKRRSTAPSSSWCCFPPVGIAQHTLDELARRGPRQLIDEVERSWALEGGQSLAAVAGQLVGQIDARRDLGDELDDRLDLLAEVGVGNAEHGDVEDGGMAEEDVFDLARVDVDAARDDLSSDRAFGRCDGSREGTGAADNVQPVPGEVSGTLDRWIPCGRWRRQTTRNGATWSVGRTA
jgi:hypothetical protein